MPILDPADQSWPVFGKISAAVEGFIYYTHYSIKVIIHDLAKWFPSPSIHSNLLDIVMLLSGVFSFILGYLSDDLIGKYRVVLFTYVFVVVAFFLSGVAIHLPFVSSETKNMIFITSVYLWFPFFANEASRVSLISEQFKLPQSLRNLKMFYFCFMLSRYAGSGMSGILVEVEQHFGGHETQMTIRFVILFVVVCSYCSMLIFFSHHIRKKRVHIGFVDSVIACIASALYNRAFTRKKMPANTKWIDYSDAKHYKETKDSAVQLVQMSLIFLPFSIFFGLNEFLDAIWMEQNDWIISEGFAFIGSVSIITIYHAVDVILIPVFEYLIEFLAPRRCNIILTDLQLIGSAIFLLGMAYLSTTIFQSQIENGSHPRNPTSSSVQFFNGLNVPVTVSTPYALTSTLLPGECYEMHNLKPLRVSSVENSVFTFPAKISVHRVVDAEEYSLLPAAAASTSFFVISENSLTRLPSLKNPTSSYPVLNIISALSEDHSGQIQLKKLKGGSSHHHSVISHEHDLINTHIPGISEVERVDVSKGLWKMSIYINGNLSISRDVNFLPRSVSTLFLYSNDARGVQATISQSDSASTIHIWYAIPQILLRSLADGIGKISTYYFTYTQSPRKLRATAFGVLYFAQYCFPGIFGMISSVWREGFTSFILSLYTFIAFIALVLFIYFSLKYEEI